MIADESGNPGTPDADRRLYCLTDLRDTPEEDVQVFPRWLWAVIICFVTAPIGGMAYLRYAVPRADPPIGSNG
ncbi:hypothetical protein [Acrocarpospora catenulata]|uniref:hypothetical protein n=1 Tax=Acrocarpospora catenulata TaxID=2836182 RepID=UPI001BDAC8BC|nr:hypothetical protein [Acrocarpospora catenulata]